MGQRISSSKLAAEFMQLPKYLKVSIFFRGFPSEEMFAGDVQCLGQVLLTPQSALCLW